MRLCVCLSWFKETGGLHSVRRSRVPTSNVRMGLVCYIILFCLKQTKNHNYITRVAYNKPKKDWNLAKVWENGKLELVFGGLHKLKFFPIRSLAMEMKSIECHYICLPNRTSSPSRWCHLVYYKCVVLCPKSQQNKIHLPLTTNTTLGLKSP